MATVAIFVRLVRVDVAAEVRRREPAAALALAGVFVGTGNVVRMSITGAFEGCRRRPSPPRPPTRSSAWSCCSWCAGSTDWLLLPGVTIRQEVIDAERCRTWAWGTWRGSCTSAPRSSSAGAYLDSGGSRKNPPDAPLGGADCSTAFGLWARARSRTSPRAWAGISGRGRRRGVRGEEEPAGEPVRGRRAPALAVTAVGRAGAPPPPALAGPPVPDDLDRSRPGAEPLEQHPEDGRLAAPDDGDVGPLGSFRGPRALPAAVCPLRHALLTPLRRLCTWRATTVGGGRTPLGRGDSPGRFRRRRRPHRQFLLGGSPGVRTRHRPAVLFSVGMAIPSDLAREFGVQPLLDRAGAYPAALEALIPALYDGPEERRAQPPRCGMWSSPGSRMRCGPRRTRRGPRCASGRRAGAAFWPTTSPSPTWRA